MINNLKDYKLVVGSFRLLTPIILEDAVQMSCDLQDENQKILVDTGVSYNVDHLIGQADCLDKIDIMSKFGVDHLGRFDWYLENHLRFLNKEKLAYGLIHFYEPCWEDLMVKLFEAKEKGLIDHVGVSNFNIDQITEFYEKFGEYPEVNEIEYSIRYHDKDLVDYCHINNIEVLGYGVLGGIHACKQYKREYLVDELMGFAYNDGVIPIIRTDNQFNLAQDVDIYRELVSGNLEVRDLNIKSNHYSLDANVTDDRALNKFKYDKPKNILYVDYDNYYEGFTMDSRLVMGARSKKVMGIDISGVTLTNYLPVPRKFMMITDYIVEKKFEMSEDDNIVVSDDTLFNNTTGDFYSFIMYDNNAELIKSGSCEAHVLMKYENRLRPNG